MDYVEAPCNKWKHQDYDEAPCKENRNTEVMIMLKHHSKKKETKGQALF